MHLSLLRKINTNSFCSVSDIYKPAGTTYRIGTADLAQHITFMNTINSKLNPGSKWWIEVGHNGNGNIEQSDSTDATGTVSPLDEVSESSRIINLGEIFVGC
jgi:hypothetical protein